MTPAEERKLHAKLLKACAQLFNCGEHIYVRPGGPFAQALDALWQAVKAHPWASTPSNEDFYTPSNDDLPHT